MLKGIDPRITPELLYALAQMGHGDDLVIVDANFPSASLAQHMPCKNVLHIAGRLQGVTQLVLNLIPLDGFVPAAATTMQVVGHPDAVPDPVAEIIPIIQSAGSSLQSVDRFSFYDLARSGFAIVQHTDTRPYGNVILKKGVLPVLRP